VKCKTIVEAGVCGFSTTIHADSMDDQNVIFAVETDCDKVKALSKVLPAVDAYQEIGAGFDGELLKTVRANMGGCCAGCVVPVALFKSMQVAAKLALPRDVKLTITKTEN
jgi:hypothetical protein